MVSKDSERSVWTLIKSFTCERNPPNWIPLRARARTCLCTVVSEDHWSYRDRAISSHGLGDVSEYLQRRRIPGQQLMASTCRHTAGMCFGKQSEARCDPDVDELIKIIAPVAGYMSDCRVGRNENTRVCMLCAQWGNSKIFASLRGEDARLALNEYPVSISVNHG